MTVTLEQFHQIRAFVHDYLVRTATTSSQEWVSRFPRAAEHRWHHTLNVLKNAETILTGENASPESTEVVRIAVYLHDVSIFACDHRVHGQVGAAVAETHLLQMGLPLQFADRVKRAVAEHGTELGDRSPDELGALFSWEGKVLLEADILDKLGAIAITGGLLKLGARGILPHEAYAALSAGSSLERARIFKDYFWTDTGRRLSEERFECFLGVMAQLKSETHDPEGVTAEGMPSG